MAGKGAHGAGRVLGSIESRRNLAVVSAAFAAAVMALSATTASAANDDWNNSAGGSWGTNGNWSLNSPPGDANQAVFSLGATTAYTVTGGGEVGGFTVQNDQVIQDLTGSFVGMNYTTSGGDLNLNVTATTGNSAALTLNNSGATASMFTVCKSVVLSGAGSTSLTVNNVEIVNDDLPAAGFTFGAGSTVTVENGGELFNQLQGNMSVAGTATFNDGSASVVQNVTVGGVAGAALNLSNGSTVSAGSEIVIGTTSAVGSSQVDDSTLEAEGSGLDILSVGGGTYGPGAFPGKLTANGGIGSLAVSDGGVAEAVYTFIGNAGGAGTVTVSGTGSKLNAGVADIGIGSTSSGTVTVSGGASMSDVGSSYIGGNLGSGTLTVSGTGTTWSAGSVTVGQDQSGNAGAGSVTIDTQATGTLTGTLTIEANATLDVHSGALLSVDNLNLMPASVSDFTGGTVRLTGGTLTDAALTLTSTTTLQGIGTVSGALANNGVVMPGTTSSSKASPGTGKLAVSATYTQSATGALDFNLGGTAAGTGYDQLNITGAATLSGALNVGLTNSFVPSIGEQFDLMTWANEAGTFTTVDLPVLPGGETWDTSQLYVSGTISVVPEPATVGIMGLAGAMLGVRRRRR